VRLVAFALAGLLMACGDEQAARGGLPTEALVIDDQEGAVCGMIVSDQSAPRGQVVHRDGHRAFLCSIGDLLAYLDVPSPHGAPEAVLVEVMDPGEDPMETHLGEHPWLPASEAVYVVGIPRRGIMGKPVLVYQSEEEAAQIMVGTEARALRFAELEDWWRSLEAREHP
jgi:nitrous oxide reductase accessory protein NosL